MKAEYEDDIRYMRLSDEEIDEDETLDYEELDFDRTERNIEHLRNRWRKKIEP